MSELWMDWERERRTGVAEAVFCAGKTPAQIEAAAASAVAEGRRLLMTRLAGDIFASLPAALKEQLDYDPSSATAILGGPSGAEQIAGAQIVAAGTSDLGVAREAARTLSFHGFTAPLIADVGVAGLWRLLAKVAELRAARGIIAVAGMEGALFSVLAGLVEAPVIAVPTSIGYGVAAGGMAALNSALASCATGLVVVNVDNGFGAAAAAIKILRARTVDQS